jgi:ferric-dicitrate binding protein FerR (iron transport regulator)
VEIEDLKQSEGFGTLEIAHYASHLELEGRCASGIGRLKTKSLSKKETKVRTLNFKTFFKVAAVLAVLLTLLPVFFNNTQSYETGIAQTKTFRLPDNSKFY